MTTGIGHFELIVDRQLLGGLNLEGDPMAFGVKFAAGAFVQGELGIQQVTVVLRQPLRTVKLTAAFLTTGEGELERTRRHVVLGAQAHEEVRPDRGLGFVVERAACVEVAVLLDQRERIARPVLALGFDHVDVREQQDRLAVHVTTWVRRDEHAVFRVRGVGQEMQVALGKPRRFEARRHPLGRERAAAGGVGGVGLHQFLVQRPETRFALGRVARHGGRRKGGDEEQQAKTQHRGHGGSTPKEEPHLMPAPRGTQSAYGARVSSAMPR